MTDPYLDFLRRKSAAASATGFDPGPDLHPSMMPHQRDVTRWALRRGRAALFLDTGLGKTLCQLEWARRVVGRTGGRVLILAPLAVAEQTVAEAERWGIRGVEYRREEGSKPITVANYEMLSHFDTARYVGVVLDESSILKSFNGATMTALTEAFARTAYRLACTATPSPNDFTELGNHSEWLGIKSRVEMLAEYFVHDGGSTQDWRLKGHAHDAFWSWVASWGALVRRPSDLGYEDGGYALPPLRMHEHVVPVDHVAARADGLLFADDARSLSDQRRTRRETRSGRVELAARIAREADGQALVWCELNDEADAVTDAIGNDAVQVAGSDKAEYKAARMLSFALGERRVLVSKPSICGFGMNFQRCACQVFVGASHSYEQTYQAIRRSWRFGQTRPVDVHVIRAETEAAIVENFRRKEQDAERMGREMASRMGNVVRGEVGGAGREWRAHEAAQAVTLPGWMR